MSTRWAVEYWSDQINDWCQSWMSWHTIDQAEQCLHHARATSPEKTWRIARLTGGLFDETRTPEPERKALF